MKQIFLAFLIGIAATGCRSGSGDSDVKDVPSVDPTTRMFRENFEKGRPPQEADLQLGKIWSCQHQFAIGVVSQPPGAEPPSAASTKYQFIEGNSASSYTIYSQYLNGEMKPAYDLNFVASPNALAGFESASVGDPSPSVIEVRKFGNDLYIEESESKVEPNVNRSVPPISWFSKNQGGTWVSMYFKCGNPM